MYLQEVGWGGMDWIDLAPDMDRWGGGAFECCNEPSGFINCGEVLAYLRICWILGKDFAPCS